MSRQPPSSRSDFVEFETIPTRWNDNDIYGHMNNAVHYQIFDTVVNGWFRRHGLWHPHAEHHFVVAETGCRYHAELRFPDPVDVGLALDHIGRSSLRWRIGLFAPAAERAAADGVFVQVFVTHDTMQSLPMDDATRAAAAPMLREAQGDRA